MEWLCPKPEPEIEHPQKKRLDNSSPEYKGFKTETGRWAFDGIDRWLQKPSKFQPTDKTPKEQMLTGQMNFAPPWAGSYVPPVMEKERPLGNSPPRNRLEGRVHRTQAANANKYDCRYDPEFQRKKKEAVSTAKDLLLFAQTPKAKSARAAEFTPLATGWFVGRQDPDMISRPTHVDLSEGALKEAFHKFDLDDSGTIDRSELRMAILAAMPDAEEEEVRNLMDVVDGDGNGNITFEEFKELMHVP